MSLKDQEFYHDLAAATLIPAIIVAWAYFHGPDGNLIALNYNTGDALIVRPAPPGFVGKTQIQSGAGTVIVKESMCDVLHELQRKCGKDK